MLLPQLEAYLLVGGGGCTAQRWHSCFSPNSPGFNSGLLPEFCSWCCWDLLTALLRTLLILLCLSNIDWGELKACVSFIGSSHGLRTSLGRVHHEVRGRNRNWNRKQPDRAAEKFRTVLHSRRNFPGKLRSGRNGFERMKKITERPEKKFREKLW